MTEHDSYDVLIAGGRCAGSAAAIELGRAGYRVLLVERAKMPSDTISTHVLWPDGIAALRRLNVLDQALATGAPPARHFRSCDGDDEMLATLTPYDGIDYFLCVRRHLLDGLLFEAAAATPGVDVHDGTRLDELVWRDDRVSGARIRSGGEGREIAAGLVIGADGRDSTVARQAGVVEDDVVSPGRYWYYAYFSDVQEPEPNALTNAGSEVESTYTIATNDGLHMVIYGAFNEDFNEFRADFRNNYLRRVRAFPCLERMLDDAELVSPVYGMAGVRGYYRQMAGPGWALVGDAAHQKDPLVARGINDALLGAEDLAAELRDGISDTALERYGQRLRARTWTTSQLARMMARPDRHMSEDQGEALTRELKTPEGLARILGLQYGVTRFEDIFMTVRDRVVEVPAER